MKKFFFDFWNFFLKMVRLDYFSWIELWWMRDNEEEIKIICIWSRNIYTRKRDGVSRKEKVTFLSEMLRPDSNFQFSIYQSRFTRYYSSKNRRISLSLNITQYSNTISRNIIRDFLSTCRVCSPPHTSQLNLWTVGRIHTSSVRIPATKSNRLLRLCTRVS